MTEPTRKCFSRLLCRLVSTTMLAPSFSAVSHSSWPRESASVSPYGTTVTGLHCIPKPSRNAATAGARDGNSMTTPTCSLSLRHRRRGAGQPRRLPPHTHGGRTGRRWICGEGSTDPRARRARENTRCCLVMIISRYAPTSCVQPSQGEVWCSCLGRPLSAGCATPFRLPSPPPHHHVHTLPQAFWLPAQGINTP